jgi:hypothetical protein
MSITLTWQPAFGATQYRIEWNAGDETQERQTRALVTAPRYVDAFLMPGTYRYWVSAVGPGGASQAATIAVRISIDLALTPIPTPTATVTPTPATTVSPTPTSVP